MHQKSDLSRTMIVFLSLIMLTGMLVSSAGAATEAISGILISNVRGTTFTVSWVTDAASNGSVTYGSTTSLGTTVSDAVSSTTTHYVEINGLSLNTLYYFEVSSGGVTDNNSGSYYQVTTGPALSSTPKNNIQGTVYQSDGITVVPNAIVYLLLQDTNSSGSLGYSQLVSVRTNGGGFWRYNLADFRTSDFQSMFDFTPNTDTLRITGQGGSFGTFGFAPNLFVIPIPSANPFTQNITLNQGPTPVILSSFSGKAILNNVQLDWETASEVGLVGFNVYRSDTVDGGKQLLNVNLIPAQNPGQTIGANYQFIDPVDQGQRYYYWLELVTTEGTELTAPVVPVLYNQFFLPVLMR